MQDNMIKLVQLSPSNQLEAASKEETSEGINILVNRLEIFLLIYSFKDVRQNDR